MYDLIIVGGGPSGSSAAMVAGNLGLNALLLEKEMFPRYKPCGGALSERALCYLDLQVPDCLIEREIFGVRIHYGEESAEGKKEVRLATLVTRSVFDQFLLDTARDAGAQVRMGERVVGCIDHGNYVEVETSEGIYPGKFVLVAEGSRGKLKGLLGLGKRNGYGVSMVTEVPANCSPVEPYDVLEIHFGVADMGYGWIFPHADYYSVGVGGLAGRLPRLRSTMMNFLEQNGFYGSYRLHGHTLPLNGPDVPTVRGKFLLSGDSAGFVDPLTGEGLAFAIRSGQIAARVVAEAKGDVQKAHTLYERGCEEAFGEDLKYSRLLVGLLHSHPDIFFRIFTGNREFLSRYLDVPAMRTSYKGFFKWLLPRLPAQVLSTWVRNLRH